MFVRSCLSGVSAAVAHLNDWPEGCLKLLRRNVFDVR